MNRIARILYVANNLLKKYNGDINILKEEAKKYDNAEQLLRSGGFSINALDKAAYGFTADEITELEPKDLNIKWKTDMENVLAEIRGSDFKNKEEWAKTVDLSEPIDVIFENEKFYIDDGHHRYYAAKILGKKIKVNLSIKDKPIVKITGRKDYDYDEFHRSFFASDQTFINKIKSLLPKLAKKSQEVYDNWDEENIDEYAGGGICHIIADELSDELSKHDIDASSLTHPFKQHVYNVAYDIDSKTALIIDLPEYVYETGGGYSWKKIHDVEITPNDFVVKEINWNDIFDENDEIIDF